MKPTESGYYWINDEIVLVDASLNVRRFGSSSVDSVDTFTGEWTGPITRKVKSTFERKTSEPSLSESTL